MLNKQRCTSETPGKESQTRKNPSKKGNPVSKYGDTANMEYKPVKKTPGWDGKGEKATW
jgi:hypothetical protein